MFNKIFWFRWIFLIAIVFLGVGLIIFKISPILGGVISLIGFFGVMVNFFYDCLNITGEDNFDDL